MLIPMPEDLEPKIVEAVRDELEPWVLSAEDRGDLVTSWKVSIERSDILMDGQDAIDRVASTVGRNLANNIRSHAEHCGGPVIGFHIKDIHVTIEMGAVSFQAWARVSVGKHVK